MRAQACVLAAVLAVGCGSSDTVVAPSLSATCAAVPAEGPAPLPVTFTLNVTGAEGTFTIAIDYGDGNSGSDASARHTYETAGTYAAGFTVATATQSARCSASVHALDNPTAVPSPGPPPSSGENEPPVAVFHTEPDPENGVIQGKAPITVTFNMCQSTDPDHDRLFFKMDLDDDGDFEVAGPTGSDCRRDHTYRTVGTVFPRICVTDWSEGQLPLHAYQCRIYRVFARRQ